MFEASKMQVRFRVIAHSIGGEEYLLFTSEIYASAEAFCWDYTGDAVVLEIRKVWIRKGEAR